MKFLSLYAAPILLLSPVLLAQPPGAQGNPQPPQGRMHNQSEMQRPAADRAGERDDREQMEDERQDLGELGLPQGNFWLNPELAANIHLTSDQVHRLADTYLQGRLKIIQLEANEEMEEAKLDALESMPMMDNSEALTATDRLADARAATEKADAHLAFALRTILTTDQLMMLRNGFRHGGTDVARRQPHRSGANPGGPQAAGQHTTQPPA